MGKESEPKLPSKTETAVDRLIHSATKDVGAGALPKRYEKLGTREKAEALYDSLLTLKMVGEEGDEEAKQTLASQIKTLTEDKETYDLFKSKFGGSHLERVDLRKSGLYKEAKSLEKEIEDIEKRHHGVERRLFIGEIKGSASRKIKEQELADLSLELVEKQLRQKALIKLEGIEHTKDNTDLAAHQSYETLRRYHNQAKEGFAWLPSRDEVDEAIKGALANGRFPLLVGEPGTGKSEQADAVARELTGELCVKVACTSSTGESDLLFEKEVEGGTSYLKYGGVTKAFTGFESSLDEKPKFNHGRIVRLDEFLKINFDKTFGLIKEIGQKKSGDKMNEKIDHPVLPGSTIIATTNPSGSRHKLDTMPPALSREFAEIKVPYLPMTATDPELYEFMLASLMDDKYYLPIAKSELAPAYVKKEAVGQQTADGREIAFIEELVSDNTKPDHGALYRLSFAIKTIEDAYTAGNPDERKNYEKTLPKFNGELLTLSTSTMTLREVASWMKGYHHRFEQSNASMHTKTLGEWFAYKAGVFISQCPEDDRLKVEAVFKQFGILEPKPLTKEDAPMTAEDIGYLSPRVPRPIHLKEKDPSPKPEVPDASVPETRVVKTKDYVTVEGERIDVFPKGFAFYLRDSDLRYEIAHGQTLKVKGKEASFAGVDAEGNAVILLGKLTRKILKADFEKLLKDEKFTTYEQALSLLGVENIIRPDEVTKAFGISFENIKPIPFSEAEIELHKALGHKLSYEVNRTPEGLPLTLAEMTERAGTNVLSTNPDGTPKEYRLYNDQFDNTGKIKDSAWFSKEAALLSETPEGEWKFVSVEVIPGTENKNYLDQTDFLIQYFKENIFKISTGSDIPEEYLKAFTAWEKDKPKIQKLLTEGKLPEAAKELGEHPVSKLLRENFTSTVQRLITMQKSRNQKILPSKYSWSRSFSSGGILVSLGDFDAGGADVGRSVPACGWANGGAVFSRMKPLEIEG